MGVNKMESTIEAGRIEMNFYRTDQRSCTAFHSCSTVTLVRSAASLAFSSEITFAPLTTISVTRIVMDEKSSKYRSKYEELVRHYEFPVILNLCHGLKASRPVSQDFHKTP